MHLTETQINDFIDEALTAEELAMVQRHIANCAQCRSEIEALGAIVQRVGRLPVSIEPQRDLRPQIWAEADRKTLWNWRYPLAAAALVLIAFTSLLTVLVMRNSQDTVVRTVGIDQPVTIDLVNMERRYTAEVEDLQRALQQNRDRLAPETVRIMEENLRIIDAAIQEARGALADDPQSSMLGELLRSAYQRKLDLLKQAARSSVST
jgi:anti-sigma factor RsiW